ncbi:MAG: ATP-binding protein [Methylococcaceae bacterium]
MATAIADIIDNSITAGASSIQLRFAWNTGKPWLAIIDNGSGMSADEAISAMRLGSNNPLNYRSINDLGRFGLGLKTASFSQCRQLTVITRKQHWLQLLVNPLKQINDG